MQTLPVSPRETLRITGANNFVGADSLATTRSGWSRDTTEYVPRNFTEHDYFVTHSHLPISKTDDIDDVLWQYGDQFWRRMSVGGFASLIDDLVDLLEDTNTNAGYVQRYSFNETVHFNLVKEAAKTVRAEKDPRYLYQYMRLFLKNKGDRNIKLLEIYARCIIDRTRNRLKLSTIVEWWLELNKIPQRTGTWKTQAVPVANEYRDTRNCSARTAFTIESLRSHPHMILHYGKGLLWLLANFRMYIDDVTPNPSHRFFWFVDFLKTEFQFSQD